MPSSKRCSAQAALLLAAGRSAITSFGVHVDRAGRHQRQDDDHFVTDGWLDSRRARSLDARRRHRAQLRRVRTAWALRHRPKARYRVGKGRDFVIEGDEHDSAFFDKTAKFLKHLPEIAVINNIEFDHADIYADLEDVLVAFRRLVRLVPRNGLPSSARTVRTPARWCRPR